MALTSEEIDTMWEPSRQLDTEEREYHEEICEKFSELYHYVSVRIFDNGAKEEFIKRLAEAKMWANRSLVVGDAEEV